MQYPIFDLWCLVVPISKDNIRNSLLLWPKEKVAASAVYGYFLGGHLQIRVYHHLYSSALVAIAYWRLRWQYSETRNTSYTFLMNG